MKYTMKTCHPLAVKAYTRINQRRLHLPRNRDLTLRQICGRDFWRPLNDAQRRFLGKFVSVAVGMGLLELVQVADKDSANHCRYRLP